MERVKTRFQSKRPSWAVPLILLGAIVYVLVVAVIRRTVVHPAFPFCARCASTRRSLLIGGLAATVVGTGAVILGLALSGEKNTAGGGGLLALAGFCLALAGLIVMARAGRAQIAGGVVSQDGAYLDFPKASQPFVDQLAAADSHARYQHQLASQQRAQWAAGQWAAAQPQRPYGSA